MNELFTQAYLLGQSAHAGQKRKYHDNVDYFVHPVRVAMQSAIYTGDVGIMEAAALLHDVLEDTDTKAEAIAYHTSHDVLRIVQELTNPSKGSTLPRDIRKKLDRDHLRVASKEAKILKMLDRIDNLQDMANAPDDFKKLYCRESLQLLEVVGNASKSIAFLLAEAIVELEG